MADYLVSPSPHARALQSNKADYIPMFKSFWCKNNNKLLLEVKEKCKLFYILF